jgi:hypothetical protein
MNTCIHNTGSRSIEIRQFKFKINKYSSSNSTNKVTDDLNASMLEILTIGYPIL